MRHHAAIPAQAGGQSLLGLLIAHALLSIAHPCWERTLAVKQRQLLPFRCEPLGAQRLNALSPTPICLRAFRLLGWV